jgi:hypothetical protein
VHFFGGIFPSKMGRFSPFLATIQALSKTCVFLLNRIPVMASISAPIFGDIFFWGIFTSKMGRFSPFLATIQAISKTCVFLLNKRSEGCFEWAALPLVLAPTIFIIALFS